MMFFVPIEDYPMSCGLLAFYDSVTDCFLMDSTECQSWISIEDMERDDPEVYARLMKHHSNVIEAAKRWRAEHPWEDFDD